MQIEKLKEYYQDALVLYSRTSEQHHYYWFLTDTGEKVGIRKDIVTEKDLELLLLFLTPFHEKKFEMNTEQQKWTSFLYGNGQPPLDVNENSLRFIHFLIKKGQFDYQDLQEGLQALFPTDIIIIWKNENEGTIIEKKDDTSTEMVSFHEIVDTLSSDFYLTICLFVGQTKHFSSPNLLEEFLWEENIFHKALQINQNKKVFQIQDVLPYIFLKEISPKTRKLAMSCLLNTIEEDHDLINSIKVFIECNLNVSSAAKKLYMHRNSLQYRIDKFIEKTGLDIKNFKEAMIAYLVILNYEYFDLS